MVVFQHLTEKQNLEGGKRSGFCKDKEVGSKVWAGELSPARHNLLEPEHLCLHSSHHSKRRPAARFERGSKIIPGNQK